MPADNILSSSEDGFLPLARAKELSIRFGMTLAKIETIALQNNIMPLRYKRNMHTLDTKEQLILLGSHVVIVGCGGLGGYVAEHLTRIGVGNLTLIDDDVFCEHNLNRQRFANLKTIGKPKVTAAKISLQEINPSVTVNAIAKKFTLDKTTELGLDNADVVIDALDNIPTKRELAMFAVSNKIPLIHGAIAGTTWQVGDAHSVLEIYDASSVDGINKHVGNLTYTVGLCAAIQASEAVKALLGKPTPISGLIIGDLMEFETQNIELPY